MTRLAIVTSHPVQYYSPLFAELAKSISLKVFFGHRATPQEQAAAGFGTAFEWDTDLLAGFEHEFLQNVSRSPGTGRFSGCDTPRVYETLRRGQFDALLVTGWHLKSYWQAILAAKRIGMPVIVRGDSHLNTPRSFLKKAIKKLVYPIGLKVFDAALCPGTLTRNYYLHYRFSPEKIFFSPHAIDVDVFSAKGTAAEGLQFRSRAGIGTDEVVVLFCGKLMELKRPGDAVAACALLRRNGMDCRLMVAGTGALAEQIEATAREVGLPLSLLGFCNQGELPAVYAAADVLVLPSQHETWGLVANEALACCVPVVLSDQVGCVPDFSPLSEAVGVYPVGDIPSMAEAIARVAPMRGVPALFQDINQRFSFRQAVAGILRATSSVTQAPPT